MNQSFGKCIQSWSKSKCTKSSMGELIIGWFRLTLHCTNSWRTYLQFWVHPPPQGFVFSPISKRSKPDVEYLMFLQNICPTLDPGLSTATLFSHSNSHTASNHLCGGGFLLSNALKSCQANVENKLNNKYQKCTLSIVGFLAHSMTKAFKFVKLWMFKCVKINLRAKAMGLDWGDHR